MVTIWRLVDYLGFTSGSTWQSFFQTPFAEPIVYPSRCFTRGDEPITKKSFLQIIRLKVSLGTGSSFSMALIGVRPVGTDSSYVTVGLPMFECILFFPPVWYKYKPIHSLRLILIFFILLPLINQKNILGNKSISITASKLFDPHSSLNRLGNQNSVHNWILLYHWLVPSKQ